MLTKKTLVIGLVLAVLALVMVGGRGEGSATHVDFRVDISRLGEESCEYWAPSPKSSPDRTLSGYRLRIGVKNEVLVSDPDAVSLQLGCTDQPTCLKPEPELDCFLAGEHYVRLRVFDPIARCVSFTVKGLRGAAASARVNGVKQEFQYLSIEDDGVNRICGLRPGDWVELRMMMCPDPDGDRLVGSLFRDIMPTAQRIGTDENHPDWEYKYDYNEDGIVDYYGDLFAVMFRYGLKCNDFDY